MPLTVETGPRIYLEIDNETDREWNAQFTWSTMDMEQFMIKHEIEIRELSVGCKEVFTFDHNCNHIMLTISCDTQAVFETKLESYTVSRTYILQGTNGTYTCISHEN